MFFFRSTPPLSGIAAFSFRRCEDYNHAACIRNQVFKLVNFASSSKNTGFGFRRFLPFANEQYCFILSYILLRVAVLENDIPNLKLSLPKPDTLFPTFFWCLF